MSTHVDMENASAQAPQAPRPKSLTIGAVCKALSQEFPDISISKIRYLEDQKLLAPRRTPGGYRLYSSNDVSRLRTILRLQRDEFLPLRVIRQELAAGRSTDDDVPRPAATPGDGAPPADVPGPDATGPSWSAPPRPDASSWRMTRSGRNSSRCSRRIVRRRTMSDDEYSR